MKAGDVSAFATLYDLYSPDVYALCLHYCKDEADAVKMLEAAYLKFWQRRGSLGCPPAGVLQCILGCVVAVQLLNPITRPTGLHEVTREKPAESQINFFEPIG